MELYRSDSKYGWCLKLCLLLFVIFLVVVAVILFSIGEPTYGAIVLAVLVAYLVLYWVTFPKRLSVHEDAIRIQSCCGVAIPLETVSSVELDTHDFQDKCNCICNCATICFGPKVYIHREKGANYVLSPKDAEQFVEAAQAQLSVVHAEDGEMDEAEPGVQEEAIALEDTGAGNTSEATTA